jgi:molybdopterin converting factor subunit 1
MQVTVCYFAVLKDKTGCSEEQVNLTDDVRTAADLYLLLSHKYSFPLALTDLRVAIDDDFTTFEHSLRGGERVVFIPPVAGG